jgi:hypothetical protein
VVTYGDGVVATRVWSVRQFNSRAMSQLVEHTLTHRGRGWFHDVQAIGLVIVSWIFAAIHSVQMFAVEKMMGPVKWVCPSREPSQPL